MTFAVFEFYNQSLESSALWHEDTVFNVVGTLLARPITRELNVNEEENLFICITTLGKERISFGELRLFSSSLLFCVKGFDIQNQLLVRKRRISLFH